MRAIWRVVVERTVACCARREGVAWRCAGVQGLFDYGFGYVYYDDVDVDDLGSSSRAGGEMLLGWLAGDRPAVSVCAPACWASG